MKSTNCLTSSMIKVGDILERKISFTHQDVVDYCNLAKDFNAIHHDMASFLVIKLSIGIIFQYLQFYFLKVFEVQIL